MSELKKLLKILKRGLFPGPDKITKIWIGVTDECNSRCTTCNTWKNPKRDDLLTPDEIYKVLSDPILKDVDLILNSGGEPTTRDDLYEFIAAEHRALPKARLQISTNGIKGLYLKEIVWQLLEDYPDLKLSVGTSLDGIEEEHDSIRGTKGNYCRTIQMIEYLKFLRNKYGKERLQIGFGTVLTPRTAKSIPTLKQYAEDNDLEFLVQWFNRSDFYNNKDKVYISNGMERQIVKDCNYSILTDMWLNWMDGKSIKFDCYALRTFFALKCNGDVVPCLTHWDHVIGNVKKHADPEGHLRPMTISEVLSGSRLKAPCVKDCEGCLNSWGVGWSMESTVKPYLKYYLKHPIKLLRQLL
jgi:MoaA/NifB/PqqE/SkfB family radical SAM enzyme